MPKPTLHSALPFGACLVMIMRPAPLIIVPSGTALEAVITMFGLGRDWPEHILQQLRAPMALIEEDDAPQEPTIIREPAFVRDFALAVDSMMQQGGINTVKSVCESILGMMMRIACHNVWVSAEVGMGCLFAVLMHDEDGYVALLMRSREQMDEVFPNLDEAPENTMLMDLYRRREEAVRLKHLPPTSEELGDQLTGAAAIAVGMIIRILLFYWEGVPPMPPPPPLDA